MKIYIVRHGQSENNRRGLWTGWEDVPLTENGIYEAKKVGEFLRGVKFDKVYTSDLGRAEKTAELAIPDCDFEPTPLLREIDVGSLANQPYAALSDEDRKLTVTHGYVNFGGETRLDFKARVLQFKTNLEALECENVAVFSHAGWLREFLYDIIEVRLVNKTLYCGNCAVGVFEYLGGAWRLHSWVNLD